MNMQPGLMGKESEGGGTAWEGREDHHGRMII